MAERFIKARNDIEVTEQDTSPRLAIPMVQQLRITKKASEADFTVAIDNHSKTKIATATTLKDPSHTYKFSYNNVVQAVNDRIIAQNIHFEFVKISGEVRTTFTTSNLQLFMKFYDIKSDSRFAYEHHWANHSEYSYSQQLIEFITGEIKKDPVHIIKNLKMAKK